MSETNKQRKTTLALAAPAGGARAFSEILRARADEPGLRKGERTRRLVRWATAQCLVREAYASLSIDTIVREACVSRPAFYQYFRSKADVVRDVLGEFQRSLPEILTARVADLGLFQAVCATNRIYIDFVRLNAPLMHRISELRAEIPELIAARQKLNAVHAARIAAAVRRYSGTVPPAERLAIRIHALEFMVDDFLRELFVIRNPNLAGPAKDFDALAYELSIIWFRTLFPDRAIDFTPASRGPVARR